MTKQTKLTAAQVKRLQQRIIHAALDHCRDIRVAKGKAIDDLNPYELFVKSLKTGKYILKNDSKYLDEDRADQFKYADLREIFDLTPIFKKIDAIEEQYDEIEKLVETDKEALIDRLIFADSPEILDLIETFINKKYSF